MHLRVEPSLATLDRIMATNQTTELEVELGRLRHGQHLCLFHEGCTAAQDTIVPFFRDGLARDERCLFIAEADSVGETLALLASCGIDARGAIDRGALQILSPRAAYLPHGRFEPQAMLEMLERRTDEALADGYAGLRASGDMSWALGPEAVTEQLIEYEAVLNDVASRRAFIAICRYDLHRFPPEIMRDILRVHPQVVIASLVCPSTYYEPPAMALGQFSEAERLRWTIGQLYEARAAKRALERAVEARDAAVRARDQFLAVAAHELRTPLTALSLQLQSADREIERRAIEGLGRKMTGALRASRHMTALVENMLDVARAAAGHTEVVLHPEQVELVDVAKDVVDRFHGSAPIVLAANGPVVGLWDRVRIDEVVTNLVSNACKYGGARPIEVAVERRGDRARLSVSDQGIGVAEEDRERIFEPFERAVSSDSYGGLGLGLFITRRIVEAHGGTIRLASARGSGSTFTVELPIGA